MHYNQMTELKQQLESVYCTKDVNTIEEPYIILKFISFNRLLWKEAEIINRYVWYCNKRIVNSLIVTQVPKHSKVPFISYIKKQEEKESELHFLLVKVKEYYKWSEKEIKIQLPILLKLFEDKNILREYFRFFGIEEKYYKKYGIEFKTKDKGLSKWFGGK